MAKTDRTVLISNDQEFGQVADPNKLEAQITHAFDKIDYNDNEFIAHQKQVDPTYSDNVRDKHVSNNDLKGLQDQITTNLTDLTTHKKQVDPTSSDTTRDKHVANNDLKTLQDQITTNNTASVNRDNAHKNAMVLDHPDQSVTTEKLKDLAVTRGKVALGAIGREQLDNSLWEQTANNAKFQEIDAQLADITKKLPQITPELFGAPANGVDDDSAAYESCLTFAEQNGGAKIVFTPGKTYRIGKALYALKNTPNNTHIEAYGAYIKATEGSSGTCLMLGGISTKYSKNISLKGGIFDGNWNGGTGTGRWEGATGTITDDGQEGNQPTIMVQYSENVLIQDVIVVNSVNDGINGHYNTDLTFINCSTKNTAEHGFYIGYSSNVKWDTCKVTNFGLNNWNKSSAMIKMRQAKRYYVNVFVGKQEITSTADKAFTEGAGEHIYLNNINLESVGKIFNFTAAPDGFWGNTNNNIHIQFMIVKGTNISFGTVVSETNCMMKNCHFEGFTNKIGVFATAENITFKNCTVTSGSIMATSSALNKIKNVTFDNCSGGYISFYGTSGSIFEDLKFIGSNIPTNNRIYGDNIIFKNLYIQRDTKTDSSPFFVLYDANVDFVNVEVTNVALLIRNSSGSTQSGKKINLKNIGMKNCDALLEDIQGVPKIYNVSNLINIDTLRAFYAESGVIVNYANVVRLGTTTAFSLGAGTFNKVTID